MAKDSEERAREKEATKVKAQVVRPQKIHVVLSDWRREKVYGTEGLHDEDESLP